MALRPQTFKRAGIALAAVTLLGLVEAVFTDRLSPGARLGLGFAGFQAAVIGWAALGATAGEAARRGALGGLAASGVVAALALLSFAVDGSMSGRGVRSSGTEEPWSSVVLFTFVIVVVVVVSALMLGLAARNYTRLPADRPMRYVWLFVAVGPILTSIQPDDVYPSRPSTWSAFPALIPETLLSIAALLWLALLLRTTRDRLSSAETPAEAPATGPIGLGAVIDGSPAH